MRAIKALVIGMSTLLVVGLGLLAYGMMKNAQKLSPRQAGEATAAADGFGELRLPLPAGARLEQMEADAGRLLLRLAVGDEQRVVVLDLASGRIAGTVHLGPQPAPERRP